jgi:excisionase family DNA binding protein
MLIYLYVPQPGIVERTVVNLDGEEFLTAAEACARMGVKTATLYAYVSRGLLQSYRQGIQRRRLYRRRDVEKLLELRPSSELAAVAVTEPLPARREVPRAEDWIPFVN